MKDSFSEKLQHRSWALKENLYKGNRRNCPNHEPPPLIFFSFFLDGQVGIGPSDSVGECHLIPSDAQTARCRLPWRAQGWAQARIGSRSRKLSMIPSGFFPLFRCLEGGGLSFDSVFFVRIWMCVVITPKQHSLALFLFLGIAISSSILFCWQYECSLLPFLLPISLIPATVRPVFDEMNLKKKRGEK